MTKKCFVPKCKSGYKTCKEKVSLFKVPNNETLFQQWRSAIAREDRAISTKDHVCEKHFQEEDIIRFWIYKDIKDKLKIPRLKKNAVPSIFPNPDVLSEDVIEEKPPKKREKKPKVIEPDHIQLYESIQDLESLTVLKEVDLFNKLWNDEILITFPTPSWAIHKVENELIKVIVFSDVIVTNNVPCYQKQIIMNEDHTVSIIIGTSIISQEDQVKHFGNPVGLESMEDLSILISTLHLLNLTTDGITFETEYCEMQE